MNRWEKCSQNETWQNIEDFLIRFTTIKRCYNYDIIGDTCWLIDEKKIDKEGEMYRWYKNNYYDAHKLDDILHYDEEFLDDKVIICLGKDYDYYNRHLMKYKFKKVDSSGLVYFYGICPNGDTRL